ncbi:hypothetical protein LQV05_003766 [Cryptococcus neoformans]|nr:hypothetical protein LQV05_003766 [Cryptococcus neoformans]
MTIHALWIISKAGGLVFSRSYSDALPQLPVNTILTLAGILHGIHAITARLTPSSPNQNQGSGSGSAGGLESFEAEGWGGKVFLTPTGESGPGFVVCAMREVVWGNVRTWWGCVMQ